MSDTPMIVGETYRGFYIRDAGDNGAAPVLECCRCGKTFGACIEAPRCPDGCPPGPSRNIEPKTEKARKVVKLLRAGRSVKDAARLGGMAVQSAEKLRMRWVVLPELYSLRQQVRELRGH